MKVVFAFLIVIIAGYFSGLGLEAMLEGDDSKFSKFSNFSIFHGKTYSFIKSAELSGALQGIINTANISFEIDPLPTGDVDGNKFFVNRVNECTFHSPDSISGSFFYDDSLDDGICIVCKLKGDCKNVNANFLDLPHGSKIGAINTKLSADGVVVTATNFGNGPDTVIIFDGDTSGDLDEDPTPDPDLRASGICSDCAGKHMLIIPENTNDSDIDNLVDSPDDDAAGGIMKFQFDQPRKIVSFEFYDHDGGGSNDKARAYTDFSCTQLIGSAVTIPSTSDGGKTIISDAQWEQTPARCLKIEYHDSGALTNLILECVETSTRGTTLGSGQFDLIHGYTGSDEISIPIEDIVPIENFDSVEINIVSTILDFSELDHGDVLNTQFMGDYGVKVSGCYNDGASCLDRDPIVFDTDLGNTSDDDLEVDIGNISIVQENTNGCGDGTCNDPDDNASGGEQRFQFDPERYINSLVFVDADRPNPSGTIFFYRDYACTDLIDQGNDPNANPPTMNGGILIPFSGDKTTQVLVPVNIEKVGCMNAVYADSGGLSRINLGCPLPDDPLIATFDWDYNPQNSEEQIYYFDFESYSEEGNWNAEQSFSGNYFGIIGEGDYYAHSGSKVLAGWGNFDPEFTSYNRNPLDISDYHDVILSVWYSYEDTESADDFYFYYKDGSDWIPIITVTDPNITPVQSVWNNAFVFIPEHIDSLELQFKWSTSSDSEHVMIDNLEILGTPN